MVKGVLKAAARRIVGDYCYYRIFTTASASARDADAVAHVSAVDAATLERAASIAVREQAWYGGDGTHVFAWREQGECIAMCAFWHGARYAARGFWPLAANEAKLVQVIVDPAHRGRGLAPRLIAEASARVLDAGFTRLFARIWHSNTPSLRAFAAAGWSPVASVAEIDLLSVGPRLRVDWPAGRPWRAHASMGRAS